MGSEMCIRDSSYTAFDGADGVEEYTSRYGKPGSLVRYANLCNASSLAHVPPSDWVMSLEVGEHVPARFEDVIFDNIATHAHDAVVLSWAAPGQPGLGHVNTLPEARVVAQTQEVQRNKAHIKSLLEKTDGDDELVDALRREVAALKDGLRERDAKIKALERE